jgi:hypothetical protein
MNGVWKRKAMNDYIYSSFFYINVYKTVKTISIVHSSRSYHSFSIQLAKQLHTSGGTYTVCSMYNICIHMYKAGYSF